ncbi:hypothetical protein Tco_0026973 [Tanacetum coccineum]
MAIFARSCLVDLNRYRQLRIILSAKDKENYLDHPIPAAPVVAAPRQQVPPQALAAHAAWVKGSKEIDAIMLMTMDLDIQRNLTHLGAYDMLQELKTIVSPKLNRSLQPAKGDSQLV